MKKLLLISAFLLILLSLYFTHNKYNINTTEVRNHSEVNTKREKPPKHTRIKEALEYDFEITKDPALGYPPQERMSEAMNVLKQKAAQLRTKTTNNQVHDMNWTERGPSNVAGRTRTILVDQNDPSGKTVFTAGVSGGIWRTRDITVSQPIWENIYENYKNIAVTSIVQDSNNPQIMYYGTGESTGIRGLGVWKSTNGGDSWTQLTATENPNFRYIQRMLVHPVTSDVYVATRSAGLQRSQDGGETWEAAFSTRPDISDIKISSDNKLYLASGFNVGGGRIYKSETGNSGDWQLITNSSNGFSNSLNRIELAISESDPNIIYALAEQGGDAEGIYKTITGGAFWTKIQPPPALDMDVFTRGQGWYDLCIAVDPNNPDRVIIGGIDLLMSTNGGSSWTQISQWFGGGGFQYVHADQHYIMYHPGSSNTIYFSNDGGIWRTDNGAANPQNIQIFNRNNGYNVTQFYACAMHPDQYSNYFLAGSQDNGSQQFDSYGIDATRAVLGGDGFFCHIDQNEPQYQMVSLYYGDYALSNDGGESFVASSAVIGPSSGFLNPSDYDDTANIMYARANSPGRYFRWNIDTQEQTEVDLSNASANYVTHVATSPNVANRIYVGLRDASRYWVIDNAHQGNSVEAQIINIPDGGSRSISCIEIEKGNEDHMLITQSNYGSTNVFESTDGGINWQSVEGDLPDMPVRWVLFNPLDSDQAFIATEAGVWATDDLNGENTIWMPQLNGMQSVRCDMLQLRQSDKFIAVATHGRGLFTTDGLAEPLVRMNIPQVGYIDEAVKFVDYSVNPSSWMWEFGDGATDNVRDPEHTYTAIGTYPVNLTIEGNQTATAEIKILPEKETASVTGADNFTGDFEDAANTDFGAYNVSGTKFERGNSVMPNKAGTHSGENAWVVGLDEPFYENNTETMLYTPKYDLTSAGIYEFSFWARYNIQQGFDGFRVEYSTNGGRDWNVLGVRGDNWYNYDNTNSGSETVFPSGSHYFTGNTSGNNFKRFKTNITNLSGNLVAFRFVFKTNKMGTAAGLAIDDVEINALKQEGELRTIITEFSGSFPSTTELAVNWKTEPEYRSDFFEVEYSINGRDWLKFSESERFDAAGFSIDQLAYSNEYSDQKRPLYYLRVKATDLDGATFYSDIIVLRRNLDEVGVYSVYPNPFSDHINIAFNDIINGDVQVEIYDALGRKVSDTSIAVPDIFTRIDVGDLARGTYVLRVTIGEETFVEKLLKK